MPRRVLVACLLLSAAPAAAPAQQIVEAGTMHLSRAKCSWAMLTEISDFTDSVYVPVAQDMVDEGLMLAYGLLVHDYGDAWNIAWYTIAVDRRAMFQAREELTRRVSEIHPELDFLVWFAERCTEHEDLIYNVGPRTTGQIR